MRIRVYDWHQGQPFDSVLSLNQSINQVYFRIITNDTYRLLFNESQWFIDAVVIQGQT